MRSTQPEAPPPTNFALVPLLADSLAFRKLIQDRWVNGAQQRCSTADVCMDALIHLTGHNEGYNPPDELVARHAAIDRWLQWWNKTGQTQFLARHPETRPAFGTPDQDATPLDPSNLPPLVSVDAAEARTHVTDEGTWQTMLSELPPENFELERRSGFYFVLPLADEAMLFVGAQRYLLFHGKEQWDARSLDELLRAHGKLLTRLAPPGSEFGRSTSDRGNPLQLAKDHEGNLWWCESRRFGVLANGTNVVLQRGDVALRGQTYFNFGWLAPLPHGPSALVGDVDGAAAVFSLGASGIVKSLEAPLPKALREGTGANYFWDSRDRFWVADRVSRAFNAKLKTVATNQHRVLLEDRKHGIWAVDQSRRPALYRTDSDGRELRLELSGLRAITSAPSDGLVWVLVSDRLLLLNAQRDKLEVLVEYALTAPNQARLWLDRQGRVWVASDGYARFDRATATSYATGHTLRWTVSRHVCSKLS